MSDPQYTVGTKIKCDGLEWKFEGVIVAMSVDWVKIEVTTLMPDHYGGDPADEDFVDLGHVFKFSHQDFKWYLSGARTTWSIISKSNRLNDPTLGVL